MPQEQVLFISAGAHIHETYFTTVQNLNPTHVYVIYEEEIMVDNPADTDFLKSEKPKIRTAIDEIENLVKIENQRKFNRICIPNIQIESIRDAILKIRKEKHPNAVFSFNITAGTALFTAGLFLMAIWLDGRVCVTRTKTSFLELQIPKMHVEDLNERQKKIIIALGSAVKNENCEPNEGWMKTRLVMAYIGTIKGGSNEKPQNKDKVQFSRDLDRMFSEYEDNKGRAVKGWDLIEERGRGREKEYRLLPSGIFTWRMLESEGKRE
ncbi:hypothetical protein F1737_04620 [Methanoplanus sp. FWC-SCC4]|uniref:Uncharacterized protein n=1 Tax=Methanochimaera problematica TaxID=2609417 RepID=A0AA97FD59_9EURY|nr:hypothetical protein [Methanoplanus sp. FWC-SCC4]WOF16038.1 hypothetical protein F1737_04620 [Methanoplanus sp. FWC-SCC4]